MSASPSRAEKEASVRAAMQPVQDNQTYPLGSLKARQKRIRDIHLALNNDSIPEPPLEGLDKEQLATLQLALEGHGLYITGAAGTGKTHLFTKIRDALFFKHGYRAAVAVTASTGMAAAGIHGQTLHSWAGFSNPFIAVDKAAERATRFQATHHRWIETSVLLIDELSMIDAAYLDLIDAVARRLRFSNRPFGGIQIISSGDFFQLPPCNTDGHRPRFAFESEPWLHATSTTIHLKTAHRQADSDFIKILNECRVGMPSQHSINVLSALHRPLDPQLLPLSRPVELYALRRLVDRTNLHHLHRLPGPLYRYKAIDGTSHPHSLPYYSDMPVDAQLSLKVGAQVMLRKNLGSGLFNGSIGTVVSFHQVEEFFGSGNGHAGYGDGCARRIDLSMIGPPSEPSSPYFPLVRFETNAEVEFVYCCPELFQVEDSHGQIVAMRTQVPLSLAWSMTIHKSQGQTIQKLVVDFSGIFAPGQAYVALSRAQSLQGLQVINFDRYQIKADPSVFRWHLEAFGYDFLEA